MSIIEICFFTGLLFAAFMDLTKSIIPNRLTMGGCICGLILHGSLYGWSGLSFSLLGGFVGFILLFLLYLCRAVGGGDVKLFATIGAWMGIMFTLNLLFYSIIYAGLIAVIYLLYKKAWGGLVQKTIWVVYGGVIQRDLKLCKQQITEVAEPSRLHTFPFMYAVLPAAVTTWWGG